MFNINKGAAALQLLPSASRNASANGTGLDKLPYIGRGMVVVNIGAMTGTADVKIQDSADNITFADVAGAAMAQQAATAVVAFPVDLDSTQRYVRAVFTVGGGGTSLIAVSLVAKKRSV
jgi:hypothetical protein